MFKKLTSLSITTLMLLVIACSQNTTNASPKASSTKTEVAKAEPANSPKKETQNAVTLDVTGMVCGGCEGSIKEAVEKLEGIASCTADHKKKNVVIVLKKKMSRKIKRSPLKRSKRLMD